ncbi:MAG: DNA polymerase III subunit delta [Patescibacteria group bacterium]
MVIVLNGENGFGLGLALRQLIDAFVAEHGDLALERIDAEEVDFARIRESLTSLPFLSSKKMVILRSPSKQKEFVEKFEQLLAEIPETTEVIIVETKLDKRLSYFKYLKSKTDFRDFPDLDQNGLVSWLNTAAKERGGLISSVDARYLIERVGPNQQLLSNELDKLLLYDAKVTHQTIDLLTEPNPQSTIFQLLEAAFAGNTKQAMKLYKEQRALKVEPQQIIAMLAWQLHVLAIIKTAGERGADEIAREAKLNPFVVRKSQGIARNLSQAELKSQVSDLLSIDTKTKRTSIDPDEALQNYLMQLAS